MHANEKLLWDWARYWTAHDVDGLISLFAEDGIYEDVAVEHSSRGPKQLRRFFESTLVLFPDLVVELHTAIANDKMGAGEWTMSGTHLGGSPAQPATGKPFKSLGSCVMTFVGGRITHHKDYWNLLSFNRQIGGALF